MKKKNITNNVESQQIMIIHPNRTSKITLRNQYIFWILFGFELV